MGHAEAGMFWSFSGPSILLPTSCTPIQRARPLYASEWKRSVAHGNGTSQATTSGQSRRMPVPSTQRPRTTPQAASEMPLQFGDPTQANLAHKMAEPNKPRPAKTCRDGVCWDIHWYVRLTSNLLQLGGGGMLITPIGRDITNRSP